MTEQQRFVKKPVEISATQWFRNGDHPLDHHPMGTKNPTDEDRKRYDDYLATEGKVVRYYRHPEVSGKATCQKCGNVMHRHGWIDTLEGGHIVCPGDWIITGVQGEHYPCKPDIFEATYQPAGDQHPDDAAEDRFATAPAGELVTRCTAGLGCDEKGYCDAAATGQGDLCDRRTMAHERPVSDPDGLPEPPFDAAHDARVFADRVEMKYGVRCQAGDIADCYEWQELRRCLAAMAEYVDLAPDEREIAALREDAERYRFWREVLAGDDKAAMDLFEEELNRDVATGNRPPTGKELDKAVDVARRLRAGKEGE